MTAGDGEVDAVVTGTAQDLVLMLTGEENLGVLLRSGRIRYVMARENDVPADLPTLMEQILAVLGIRPTRVGAAARTNVAAMQR